MQLVNKTPIFRPHFQIANTVYACYTLLKNVADSWRRVLWFEDSRKSRASAEPKLRDEPPLL
jgi:hypothetical protein